MLNKKYIFFTFFLPCIPTRVIVDMDHKTPHSFSVLPSYKYFWRPIKERKRKREKERERKREREREKERKKEKEKERREIAECSINHPSFQKTRDRKTISFLPFIRKQTETPQRNYKTFRYPSTNTVGYTG